MLKYYKGEHVAMKQTIDGMMIVTITACFSTVVYSREEQEYMAAAVQVEVYSVCCHPIRCDHNVLTCLTPPPLPCPAAYLPAMHAISVWGGGGGNMYTRSCDLLATKEAILSTSTFSSASATKACNQGG